MERDKRYARVQQTEGKGNNESPENGVMKREDRIYKSIEAITYINYISLKLVSLVGKEVGVGDN